MLDRLAANPKLVDGAFLERMTLNINAPSAGGHVGSALNDIFFRKFGSVGATIVFFTLYLISMVYLTNFHLGVWLRAVWSREPAEKENKDWTPEEKALARKAKELEKQARKLQEQADKSGLAPVQPAGLG